jgi:hypothetical protein
MATRPAAPWSARPISSRRSPVTAAPARPRRALPPGISEEDTPWEQHRWNGVRSTSEGGIHDIFIRNPRTNQNPGTPPNFADRTPQEAGNFIRSLEAPKLGVDRFIESRMAGSAGTRELRGNRRGGAKYTEGPYKGLTEGQARERARQEYAGLNDAQRSRYEQGAQARDVMSARELATEDRYYNARGVAAQMNGGANLDGRNGGGRNGEPAAAVPTQPTQPAPQTGAAPAPAQPAPQTGAAPAATNQTEAPPSETPAPAANGISRPGPSPSYRGTINGQPTADVLDPDRRARAERAVSGIGPPDRTDPASNTDRSAMPEPRETPWVRDFRERTGREPRSPEQLDAFRRDAEDYRKNKAQESAAEALPKPPSATGFDPNAPTTAGISKPGPAQDEEEMKKRRMA